jgi:hypothetical protein
VFVLRRFCEVTGKYLSVMLMLNMGMWSKTTGLERRVLHIFDGMRKGGAFTVQYSTGNCTWKLSARYVICPEVFVLLLKLNFLSSV